MVDENTEETADREEIEMPVEKVLPDEKIKPTSAEREWNIRKIQQNFGVPREVAEQMLDTPQTVKQAPDTPQAQP